MFEIGNSLREARMRRAIELVQAEQATKIRGKYLRALEDERFDLLPSETYVKGFLRTYATYLGLDGQVYVDEFNSRFVTDDRYESRPRRAPSRTQPRTHRFERNIVLLALAAIALVTIVVITAWKSSGGEGAGTKPPAKKAAVATTSRKPAPYLTVAGVRGSSLVLIRRKDASGGVVFQGTVAKGDRIPFRGKWFWLNVSAPENIVISVGGRRVDLDGFRPRVLTVTPKGWQEG